MRALIVFSSLRAKVGLLGGVAAAGCMALVVYLTPGSAIEQSSAQDVVYFRIGAGTPGSTLYGLASQIAGIISNPAGSRECSDEATCGTEGLLGLAQTTLDPADSVQSLRTGSLEAAIVSGDVADAAYRGIGSFKPTGPMEELRAIANVGEVVLHIVVAKESKASDVKSLAGKRIAVGAKNSDNAVSARILLRAAGLPDKKAKLVNDELEAAGAELLTGDLDALAIVEPMPSAQVSKLIATGDYRLLGAELVQENAARYIFAEWIPSDLYAGVQSTRAVALPTVLVVRADLSSKIASGLVATLWRSAAPVEGAAAGGGVMPNMTRATVPWHPDAAATFAKLSDTTPAAHEEIAPTN